MPQAYGVIIEYALSILNQAAGKAGWLMPTGRVFRRRVLDGEEALRHAAVIRPLNQYLEKLAEVFGSRVAVSLLDES